ncbi:MAG: hypothetical protein LUF85_00470 [Bacteroides sp.]|nr:hypothetical protein [Bacteroides sp.]
MKKRVSLLCVVVMMLATGSLIAQNEKNDKKPFRHLGVGIEVGTTGVGLQVASPINSHFTLRAGFAMFPFTYSTDFDIEYGNGFNDLSNVVGIQIPNTNQTIGDLLRQEGLPTSVHELDNEVKLDAKLGLINGKVLVDMYPSKRSSFHFTAGLYFGKSRLISVDGYLPEDIVKIDRALKPYSSLINNELGYNLDLSSGIVIDDYTITADENGKVDAGIKINGVKPYVGIGFGRAVPKKRVAAQFELGAMFHGKPKIVSSNSDVVELINSELDNNGFINTMNKITVYPVMTFRLNGRIF